jgi:DtxR family transcriptional regulator, Mn-dependent transcriptional regulator
LPVNKPAKICYVADQSELLLEYLQEKKINMGSSVVVKKKFGYDGSLEIKLDNRLLTITGQLAKNIFVKHG